MPRTGSSLLKHLFESAEHADLVITTSSEDFYVHQCVVCVKSPFFKAACSEEWEETNTRRIELSEEAWVIDRLLRHMYELEVFQELDIQEAEDPDREAQIKVLIPILRAADKYQIQFDEAVYELENCLYYMQDALLMATLSTQLFSDDTPTRMHGQSCGATWSFDMIRKIMEDPTAWKMLYGNERYIWAVLEHARDMADKYEKI